MKQVLSKKYYFVWSLLNSPLSLLNDILIFILIFSFFNDNFSVELLGDAILKILFLLFVVFNGHTILRNIKKMTLLHDKLFFIFFIALLIVYFVQIIVDTPVDIIGPVFTLLSFITIIPFFSHYPLKKALYFIWASMMVSVIICFFNDTVTPLTFRTTGGTGDPNEFAAQLLAFMFISVYLFKINKSKLFIIVTTTFFIFGLFNAGSKSAFLMLGAIALLMIFKFLFYNFKDIFNYKVFFVLAILIVVAAQVDFTKIEAVANMLGRAKSSGTVETRMDSWTAGLHMIESHPLIGVGIDNFTNNTKKYADVYIYSAAPHNIYVKLLAESGIFVFILFLIFIATLLIQNFRVLVNENEIWILFAFSSLLFMGMTLGFLSDKYFLLFIAIMMNVKYLLTKGR